ncbi:GntR family transcriptional regulator [Aquibacillus sp. 3ASR75-11]|uniref:GntR family transcriptional regulator n=1 Tax=Terrihalobacillus insolitus TaxID=2950438 RepID=A0A9X3WRI2_9BACI|nr:GntR family transcriptional regulator [Terrihalobacillus insolitus]MDC3414082.1 GntR family transcriptional regulator [Terrihalobacillus insolitus]MDC3423523.1 GntR family transcriptional regulator [Terrihalobacillus insolitus]
MSIKADTRQLYLQVIDQIKRDIKNGVYKEKERLPSEFQLSKNLGVSRATLREALRLLEEENIVTRRHGVGTFVNAKAIFSSGIEQLNSVTDMIKRSGKEPGSQYLSTELIEPTDADKDRFSKVSLRQIAEIERVRTADGEPVVYCIDKIPEQFVPVNQIHKQDSLFRSIEMYAGKQIAYAVTYIEPIGYHERISPVLHCEPDQSLLLLKQMHYTSSDEPVLYSLNYFRSDVFLFYVLRKRM